MGTKIKCLLAAMTMALSGSQAMSAQDWSGLTGFATYSDLGLSGVTGGGAGEVVHVTTRAELAKYASASAPYVIIIDNDIEGGGMNDLQDELSINSNKTILGAGAGVSLNGVALIASGKQNIIVRNINLKKGRIDGVAFHNCHHVWVDHCDLSESYDGLLDVTNGSDYFTISWVSLHNHNKVSITNSGTCHYEDYNKERITFAHCMFKDNTQRNPRIGYGKMHIYNCYWANISSYCIGFHSQAQVLSENNYFTATAKNPFCNQYSDQLPYCGYLTDKGSYFANGNPGTSYQHAFTGISYTPLDYYNYDFDINTTADVAKLTPAGVGPKDGLQYEPILNPGNGAIDVPLSHKLSWGNVDGASSYKMYLGTAADNMTETTPETVNLQPATKYYWRVVATVNGKEYTSPTYSFTTAAEKTSKPYPEIGEKNPWLRYPSTGTNFCTPMPLKWRPAADAKSYKVYLADNADALDAGYLGETTSLSYVPGNLITGITYHWRVDAVKNDGSVVKGDVWTFGADDKKWVEGKNEVENMYLSGIAFQEANAKASNAKDVAGDQGPGAICGTWGGPEGRYAIETAVFNQTLGPNLFGVSVNGKLVDAWLTTDENDNISIRKTRNTVLLKPGDEIRIELVAGLIEGGTNQSRSRVDYVNIVATTSETIEQERPSGIHHEPISTPGYDCEYLPMKNVIFTDTLGTIGDKGLVQVKDKYCSWISMADGKYTIYLKQTAMVKLIYRNESGVETTQTRDLDYDASQSIDVDATTADGSLFAIRLYKTMPVSIVYYTPVVQSGKDYELIWSPDVVFNDVDGTKGDKGKSQIRTEYEDWVHYYNPTANEVHTKSNVPGFINPDTDADCTAFYPNGKDGSLLCYVVGTTKYTTYYVTGCSRFKFYYTGTGGASTNVNVTVVDMDTEEQRNFDGEEAPGKNKVSAVTETELNAAHRYAVKIKGTTGDMLIYAIKLWKGDSSGIVQVENESQVEDMYFNLAGQRVSNTAKGLLIKNDRKLVVK